MHVHTCMQTCIHAYKHMEIHQRCMLTCKYAYQQTNKLTDRQTKRTDMHIYIHVYNLSLSLTHTRTHTHIQTQTHIHTQTQTQTQTQTHTHTHIHTRILAGAFLWHPFLADLLMCVHVLMSRFLSQFLTLSFSRKHIHSHVRTQTHSFFNLSLS